MMDFDESSTEITTFENKKSDVMGVHSSWKAIIRPDLWKYHVQNGRNYNPLKLRSLLRLVRNSVQHLDEVKVFFLLYFYFFK